MEQGDGVIGGQRESPVEVVGRLFLVAKVKRDLPGTPVADGIVGPERQIGVVLGRGLAGEKRALKDIPPQSCDGRGRPPPRVLYWN